MTNAALTIMWLIIAVVLGVAEAATLGIVTIWFAAGAVAAMIISLLGFSFAYQIAGFIVVSGVLLYFTRPIVKKHLRVKTHRTNADRLIGEKGVVVEKIDINSGKGQVKVLGQIWSARSSEREDIEEGEIVEIQEISGARVIVKKEGKNINNEKGEN